ncbi:lytic polysaccharide monooxygenase [Durotheca rogersii]|uniref:lytic polysaccharide monooxygenase n=1 Tax=Durotheca rogersii TaxID=419775 RepID=UPI00221E5254|nr:lytic polysaccharide monooxygenase [Durotheca rogersii]KAI5859268.1 lytic polysaccharide monooxygenase [Durotheca rogersii]
MCTFLVYVTSPPVVAPCSSEYGTDSMRSRRAALVALALAGQRLVSSHSFVSNININGLSYDGFRPTEPDAHPYAIGWSTAALDQGYVNQTGYRTEEIICHRGAENARGYAPVPAGGIVHIQWNGWPQSHKGPVMDYLASCNGPSETVDKTRLRFFKINQVGLVDGSEAPGIWGSDQLIANNNSWVVEIPRRIRPGFYVLRTEIIALHNASYEIGAQNYPQCINLQITGDGPDLPAGVPGQALYDPEDPSMHLDISGGIPEYTIPGPPPIAGIETVTLSHPMPTGSGTPRIGTAEAAIATLAEIADRIYNTLGPDV